MSVRTSNAQLTEARDAAPTEAAIWGRTEPVIFPARQLTDWTVTTGGIPSQTSLTAVCGQTSADELERAARALNHHVALITETREWGTIPADQHKHAVLEAEPDD